MDDKDYTGAGEGMETNDVSMGFAALGLLGALAQIAALVVASVMFGWAGAGIVLLFAWGTVGLDMYTNAKEEKAQAERAKIAAAFFTESLKEVADGREILLNEMGMPIGFGEKEGEKD